MKKPVTKKEKLFLIKVLLHPANHCLQIKGRDIEVMKAIKKDVLLVHKSFYPMNKIVAKW